MAISLGYYCQGMVNKPFGEIVDRDMQINVKPPD